MTHPDRDGDRHDNRRRKKLGQDQEKRIIEEIGGVRKSLRHVALGLKSSYWTGISPYKFCKDFWSQNGAEEGSLQIMAYDGGKWRKIFFGFHFILLNIYMIFLLSRWLSTVLNEGANSPKRIFMQYIVCACSAPFVRFWNNLLHYGRHHLLINGSLQVYRDMKATTAPFKKDGGDGKKYGSGFSRFLSFIRVYGSCVTLMNVAVILRKPYMPHLVTSLVPKVTTKSRLIISPLMALQLYIFASQWIAVYVNMSQISLYLRLTLECHQMLKPWGKSKGERTSFELERKKFFCKEFRKLQILQTHFDSLYSQFLVHLEAVLIFIAMLGLLAAVRIDWPHSVRPVLVAAAAVSTLAFVWVKMAEVHELSTELLHAWKVQRCTRGDWFSKYLRSTLPIKIRLGHFSYANRGLILTILSIIVNNTASLLLAQ